MLDMEDHTGRPRPREEVEAALRCIEREIVERPMGLSSNGEPLLMHYIVIREILMGYLATLNGR